MQRWQQVSYSMKQYARPNIPLLDPFWSWLTRCRRGPSYAQALPPRLFGVVVDKVSERAASRRRSPPRRATALGPSPRLFWVVVDKVSERAASRRRSPSRRATARVPAPLHTTPALTMTRWGGDFLVIMVRAGVVWSGAGTIIHQRLHIPHFQVHIGLVYERSFFSTAITGSAQRPCMNHSTYFTFPAIKHYRLSGQ